MTLKLDAKQLSEVLSDNEKEYYTDEFDRKPLKFCSVCNEKVKSNRAFCQNCIDELGAS